MMLVSSNALMTRTYKRPDGKFPTVLLLLQDLKHGQLVDNITRDYHRI